MISDNASSHLVSSTKVVKSHCFSTLELSNMTLVFLPPNVTSLQGNGGGNDNKLTEKCPR
jgi:hypothetical protein